MQEYLSQVRHLQSRFESFNLLQIPRSENTHTDSLTTLATSSAQSLPWVIFVENLCKPTKMKREMVPIRQIRVGLSQMDSIVLFLKKDILLKGKSKTNKVRRKALQFWLSKDQKLYKRFFSGPYLLCVHPKASELLLKELHEGICESHMRGRSLSHRTLTQGYWWSNMQKEAQEYIKKCDQCQKFSLNIHQPRGVLNPLSSPQPFASQGLDIVGYFLKVVGNKRWQLVNTNYFTKWVETKPLANIRDMNAKKFVWKNIVTQLRIPHALILDNGLQFDSKTFRRHCCDLDITNSYTTPIYPQGNGQVEAINKVIMNGLKERLDGCKGKMGGRAFTHPLDISDYTSQVNKSPFIMTYGADTVIPLETGFQKLRTSSFTPGNNDGLLEKSLDLIEE